MKWHVGHLKTICMLFLLIFIFSFISYMFFNGEISNAHTFTDYFYFGMTTLTTCAFGDMVATTQRARIWVAMYIFIFLYVLLFSDAIIID